MARGIFVAMLLTVSPSLMAAGKAAPCHYNNKDCECTEYFGAAGYKEVRCPDDPPVGWVAVPPRPPVAPNPGSWRGDGRQKTEENPAPYLSVTGPDLDLLAISKSLALTKLRKILIEPGPPKLWGDTTCSALFDESPLGLPGASLLTSYARFRYAPSGTAQCAADRAFVRRNQDHDRYVMLCRTFFDLAGVDPDEAANVMIHELLHVGGQQEDGTTSVGPPSDYPTSRELSEVVTSACSPPVPLY